MKRGSSAKRYPWLMIGGWWQERRQTRELERALGGLDVPYIPQRVNDAWMSVPSVREKISRTASRPLGWSAYAMLLLLALLIFSPGGINALAQTIKDVPNAQPALMDKISSRLSEWWEMFGNVYALILMLCIVGGVALAVYVAKRDDARKERERAERERDKERAKYDPAYAKWMVERDRWTAAQARMDWLQGGIVILVFTALNLTQWLPFLRLPLALLVPSAFIAYAISMLSSMVVWVSVQRDWRQYLVVLLRLLLIGLFVVALYGLNIPSLLKGLSPILWYVDVVVGIALSPLFLRLSGFSEWVLSSGPSLE